MVIEGSFGMPKDSEKGKGSSARIQARVDEKYKLLIDEFLKRKELTQADIMKDYFPALLMAIDEDLYWELYKKIYGNPKVEEIIKEGRLIK